MLSISASRPSCPVPATGPVYGVLLNFRGALAALGDAVTRPPYNAPPKAPILYLKPPNTWSAHGALIAVPRGVEALAMGGTLGVVIGRTACRVASRDALAHVAGYTVVNDVCIPHESYHRPSVRFTCRDGFCAIGPVIAQVTDPGNLAIEVEVDGEVRQRASTRDLIRPVAKLVEDVSAFMTLWPGTILTVGVDRGAPLARAGQKVSVTIAGIGTLFNTLVAE